MVVVGATAGWTVVGSGVDDGTPTWAVVEGTGNYVELVPEAWALR